MIGAGVQTRESPRIRLRDYFRTIFSGEGFIEFRALPGGARAFFPVSDPQEAKRFLATHRTKNLFFGVAARRDGTGGGLANCSTFGALFVDLDFKNRSQEQARQQLSAFQLPPSIIVASGGGLHVYWLLREALDLQTETARVRILLRRLSRHLSGDLNAAEPARVLRVPWTLNYKYDPPRRVLIEVFEPTYRYNPSEFDWLLPEEPSADVHGEHFRVPETLREGERNTMLYRLARSLKTRRMTGAAIRAALREENQARCQPPLENGEIEEIANHALTQSDVPGFKATGPDDGHHDHRRLILTPLGQFLAEPEESTTWLVDQRLPTSGLSLLAGKPKAGKSTLARCLALTVAQGNPWLGFPTRQGPVFYLALEEKPSEVRRHFQTMGATPEDPIKVFVAPSPQDGLAQLRQAAEQERPALIIVDPLMKLIRVKDTNDYAEVIRALEPLLTLARETGAHVLAVHHLGKGERSGGDAILGSTAIFAAVDTALLLKRSERYRTLSSIQRYGEDLEEIVLTMDKETRTISAGPTRKEAEDVQATEAILEYLAAQPEPVEEGAIHDAVEARRALKQKALRRLVSDGKVVRTGSGKRGDPYRYSVSGIQVPAYIRVPENQNSKIGLSTHGDDTYSGSRKSGSFDGSLDLREPESGEPVEP